MIPVSTGAATLPPARESANTSEPITPTPAGDTESPEPVTRLREEEPVTPPVDADAGDDNKDDDDDAPENFEVGDIVTRTGDDGQCGIVLHVHRDESGTDLLVEEINWDTGRTYRDRQAFPGDESVVSIGWSDVIRAREHAGLTNELPPVAKDGESPREPDPKQIDRAAGASPHVAADSEYPTLEPWDFERVQRSEECYALYCLIEKAYPTEHPIRGRFEHVLKPERDNYHATAAELRELMDVFELLPIEERRRVLNGWEPWNDIADTPDLIKCQIQTGTMYRFLKVSGGKEITAGQEYEVGGHTGLSLRIPFGMTRTEAIDTINRMRDCLMVNFEDLISRKYGDFSAPGEKAKVAQ